LFNDLKEIILIVCAIITALSPIIVALINVGRRIRNNGNANYVAA